MSDLAGGFSEGHSGHTPDFTEQVRRNQQKLVSLAVLYEGAAALATSLDDPAPWAHAHKAAEALIDQAVGS
jgi:hypothetical protein